MPYINVKLAGNLNKEQKQEIAKEMTESEDAELDTDEEEKKKSADNRRLVNKM